jgi:CRP-like cAMP-binding protein
LIPVLNYERYEKGKFVYKENDSSSKLYFFIKGSLSFRKKEIISDNDNSSNDFIEVEKFILEEDKYFGEVDILYDRKKKFSVYCNNVCHFLTIEKEDFKKIIEDKISRVETDKKLYLMPFLRAYTNMPNIKLERFILNNIQTLFFRRNEIIYKEGEENISLYIIYKGQANIIKNINKGEFSYITKFNEPIKNIQKKAKYISYSDTIKEDNKDDEEKTKELKLELLLNKTKYQIVGKLVEGSIGGLELTTGITKLKYSLVSNSEFTCVLKLDLKHFNEYLTSFMLNLLPLFIKLEKSINERITNIKLIDENILPFSCKKFKKNNKNKFEKEEEEENDKVYRKLIQKINENFQLNHGGFIKMNDYNFSLYQQKLHFKELLKNNRKKIDKIDKILKKLDKEERSKLKYTEFKVNNLILTPNKNKQDIQINDSNKKLKRPDSCISLHINKKRKNFGYGKLKLSNIDLNNQDNYLSSISLYKANKKNFKKLIKNKSFNKKKLNWGDIKSEVDISEKIRENIGKNNLKLDIIKSSIGTESIKNKNKISFIKKSLDIDDNYMKKVFISVSPKNHNKYGSNDLICLTPNNVKSIGLYSNKRKSNKINKGTMFNSLHTTVKLNKFIPKVLKKVIFYDTGNFNIPLLSDIP